jgi:hypothetical protein
MKNPGAGFPRRAQFASFYFLNTLIHAEESITNFQRSWRLHRERALGSG